MYDSTPDSGIDVWAQSKSSQTHPRITYPKKGGGGTNTGLAVRKLAELGLSAGVVMDGEDGKLTEQGAHIMALNDINQVSRGVLVAYEHRYIDSHMY